MKSTSRRSPRSLRLARGVPLLAMLVLALVAGLACEPPSDPDAPPDPRPFAELFPDATELVTTPDPAEARERLDLSILPEGDPAHDAQIAALVDAVDTIDADRLALVVDAIVDDDTADGALLAGSGKLAPVRPTSVGTVLGFSSLLLAESPGLRLLGAVVAAGSFLCMLSCLFVLAPLLARREEAAS